MRQKGGMGMWQNFKYEQNFAVQYIGPLFTHYKELTRPLAHPFCSIGISKTPALVLWQGYEQCSTHVKHGERVNGKSRHFRAY